MIIYPRWEFVVIFWVWGIWVVVLVVGEEDCLEVALFWVVVREECGVGCVVLLVVDVSFVDFELHQCQAGLVGLGVGEGDDCEGLEGLNPEERCLDLVEGASGDFEGCVGDDWVVGDGYFGVVSPVFVIGGSVVPQSATEEGVSGSCCVVGKFDGWDVGPDGSVDLQAYRCPPVVHSVGYTSGEEEVDFGGGGIGRYQLLDGLFGGFEIGDGCYCQFHVALFLVESYKGHPLLLVLRQVATASLTWMAVGDYYSIVDRHLSRCGS